MKDIAEQLGVSTGTVDRAVNDKPGINPDTRARVLAAARTLGYRPNLAARYLRSGKQVRISVLLPARDSFFWETLRQGIREAAAPFAPSLAVEFCSLAAPRGGRTPLRARALAENTDGLIIAVHDPGSLAWLEEAARRNVPVACVGADVPDGMPVLSVSADPFTVGALAGELLARFLPGGSQAAVVAGSLEAKSHAEHVQGFLAGLSMVGRGLELSAIVQSHDDPVEVQQRVRDVLRAHRGLKGLYISTSDALPVLRAAEGESRLADLTLVATDLCPELADGIRTGRVAATIYQRPLTQGRLALQLLYQAMQTGAFSTANRRVVVPYAVMSSNLDRVLERLQVPRAGDVPAPDAT